MFDLSWHNILHSNLLNFILMVLILYCLLAPIIKKAVKDNTEKTTQIVNTSVHRKELAEKKLEEVKEDYETVSKETEEIENIAITTLESLKNKAEKDTQVAKQILEENAKKSVRSEEARINSLLTKDAVEDSIKQAEEEIKQRLSQDENLHDKLIERAIDDLESI